MKRPQSTPHHAATPRNGVARRVTTAAVLAAFAAVTVGSCSSDEPGSDKVDVATLRMKAVKDVRAVAAKAGITMEKVLFTVDSCDDTSTGDAYRATITGDYPGGGSLADSQRLVGGWKAALQKDGWNADSSLVTHGGVVLSRHGAQLAMHYVDPQAVEPGASFKYSGPCHDLDGGADTATGTQTDVTAQVNR